MLLPFGMTMKILPGLLQVTVAAGVAEGGEGSGAAATGGGSGGAGGGFTRGLPLVNFALMMLAYVKLLTVRNGQLEDDIRVLRGLEVGMRRGG